jgi:TolB protein
VKSQLRTAATFAAVVLMLAGSTAAASDAIAPQITVPMLLEGRSQLVTLDLAGNVIERIDTSPAPALEPDWSPDGRQLAFMSPVNGRGQLFVKDIDSGEIRRLTGDESEYQLPAWSPDGRRIAFKSHRDGNYEVSTMRPDGGDFINLTNNPGFDADAAWSPDGRRLAFASLRDNRPFRVFVMNSDGSGQRPLVQDDLSGWLYPDWSPDGERIVFGSPGPDGSVQLTFAWIDSGTWWKVTTGKAVHSFARWSPDGRYVAYVKVPLPVDMNAWTSELYVYDIDEDAHRKVSAGFVPNQGGRPAWKPLEPQRGAEGAK